MTRLPKLAAAAGIAAGAWSLSTGSTTAHPHVWIDTEATLEFKNGKVTAIHLRWSFDDLFSSFVIGEFDQNKNKKLDKAEIPHVEKNAFSNLRNFNYFTHLKIGGEKVKITAVSNFRPSIEDGKVVYRFTIDMPKAVNPSATKVSLSVYDETFYVDVAFAKKNPVRFKGLAPNACTYKVSRDKENPIYFGAVLPQLATFSCAGS